MDAVERLELITRNAQEVITREGIKELLESGTPIKGYIGVEPSGLFTVAWMVWVEKLKDLIEAGVDMTVLLATWHAMINDKLGGDMENIRKCAKYIKQCLEALGVDVRKLSFVPADRLISDPEYWSTLFRVSKCLTLARVRRAMTILGRRVSEATIDFAKFIYPSMQVTDIFMLDLNLCLGGEDQRRAHVLAREVAPKLSKKKPEAVHTPLLMGLQGLGRMDITGKSRESILIDAKMSKSKPATCIFIHDSPSVIRDKINRAYCPPGEVKMNPVLEIAKYVIFPRTGLLSVRRALKYGGPLTLHSYAELAQEYSRGLHPLDVKMAVADALSKVLSPVRDYFGKQPSLLKEVIGMSITR